MKLNFKLILFGGLAFYVAQFILSMIMGPTIHAGVLEDLYRANASFWRPELNQDPPDMASLMPRWISVGLIITFIITGIFDNIRSAFEGSGWMKGVKFGFVVFLFFACISASWSGIFNLPNEIWMWWSIEALVMYVGGGAVLGFVAEKLSPA